ncbi:anhydro-N-acetylmuramic acid kinase [Pseudotamlana carrageenivorans]|uniref:Anhydro-N-acetylmuramic acid kinase n=1 Tax=Pseudotamlana carrageenivorans TaxID=2069432 RepID=A0A2I7SI28_9FLAO|nr:anhydro-N-acetylmuramic acid kinase [Tamlana carrageenivorans]AUS05553.1 anhydro-N-acetylmuramic acid kinase [Tamlana carrageenivorans]
MLKKQYHIIGVMSGTSLDGIDLVELQFKLDKTWQFQIINAETMAYTEAWKTQLTELVSLSKKALDNLDVAYTKYLADVIKSFIQKHNIQDIDAVCSHGHTALHQPSKKLTFQIGNLPEMAKILNEKVVCDFRVQDVELGGQGAPLVPIGDQLLFPEYDFCLNLGGFANISTVIHDKRIAYDICPMNIVLNYYVKPLGLAYDDGGKIASEGEVDVQLLDDLGELDFYKKSFPKSLGFEWVKDVVFPLIDAYQLNVKNTLRTFVEHIAIQVATELKALNDASVLVTGGGAYHNFLLHRIEYYVDSELIVPSKEVIDFKEALIFGFLGVLKLRNEVNCLQSVTGSSKNHSSGKIFLP